jgi:hypothetical protein
MSLHDFAVLVQASHKDTESLLTQISTISLSDHVIEQVTKTFTQRKITQQIALEALALSEGRGSLDKLRELHLKLESGTVGKLDTVEQEFVEDDLEVLHDGQCNTPGLRWRLQSLNEMLGSLRQGDFGFIFARPESGKTTFLASEVSFFATQTTKPVLWFNNEEQGDKVALRVYQAVLGCTTHELWADIQANKLKYKELTGGRIKIVLDSEGRISKSQVEKLCLKYSPGLILFDQIDKIHGFTHDREDLRLGFIYQWARELAKQYCPVIGVTQADGTGEGKKWLTMDNVSGAKTAKQAEADFIIGIGKSHDDGLEYVRHINISKNKLLGDEDSLPALRHGKRDVLIIPEIARFKDV